MEIIILALLTIIAFYLYNYFKNNKTNLNKNKNDLNKNKEQIYFKKPLISQYEKYFFDILTENFQNDFYIIPQLNLASCIEKKKEFKSQYQNELYRNVDFALISKENYTPVLLIEINDQTHNQIKRIKRDIKVREICEDANINLIAFYSNLPNKKEYIIDRIFKEIKKDSN